MSSQYKASEEEIRRLIHIIEEVAKGNYSNDIMEFTKPDHPEIGVDILKDLTCLGPILDYVHYHHESLDGTGYPEGLKGEEIPLGAKIISVADCFDAVTTDRPYHKGITIEEAFAMLREISAKMSPELVEAFIEEIKENGML